MLPFKNTGATVKSVILFGKSHTNAKNSGKYKKRFSLSLLF
jgi:hypothetical protein